MKVFMFAALIASMSAGPDTLAYQNDTIRQELIINRINEESIYFILTSQKDGDREADVYQGYAHVSEYACLASETDIGEDGELYPVIEFWYEDEDFPLSIRVSKDFGTATVSFDEELGLPFVYRLRKTGKHGG